MMAKVSCWVRAGCAELNTFCWAVWGRFEFFTLLSALSPRAAGQADLCPLGFAVTQPLRFPSSLGGKAGLALEKPFILSAAAAEPPAWAELWQGQAQHVFLSLSFISTKKGPNKKVRI